MRTLTMKMKKQVILFALLVCTVATYGQTLKADASIKATKTTFITTSLSKSSMAIANSNNRYHNKIPKISAENMVFTKTDKLGLLNAFTSVFSEDRLKQLLPENRMFITFYVDPQGKILDLSFIIFTSNTTLKASELENLENAIKANVSFKIDSNKTKGADFFNVGQLVRYQQVLDGTLR